jgi:hypothetical protein
MIAAPEAPLPVVLEAKGAIALGMLPDHTAGLVAVLLRGWPWARLVIAPEVALMIAHGLVRAVADLTPDLKGRP